MPSHLRPMDIGKRLLNTCNSISFADHDYTAESADETRHNVVDATPSMVARCSHAPFMAKSTSLGLQITDQKTFCADRASLYVLRGIVMVFVINHSMCYQQNCQKQLFIPKHVIKAHMIDRPPMFAPIEAILESEPYTVVAMHYNPSFHGETHISCRKAIEQHEGEKFKHD